LGSQICHGNFDEGCLTGANLHGANLTGAFLTEANLTKANFTGANKVYRYESLEGLTTSLGDRVIAPAEVKVQELEETRKAIAEELLKQRPV